MARTVLTVIALVAALFAGVYQMKLKPIMDTVGIGRVLSPVGNTRCTGVPELEGCEKITIHQPTGLVYAACVGDRLSRSAWTPAVERLNASGRSIDDYVATYDPKTKKVVKLTTSGYTSKAGLSLHGMDVVPDASDPTTLWVYLVNHRAYDDGLNGANGADSVLEVFKTRVGETVLEHVRTVKDATITTPNDVVGSDDGKSFWVTNDHGVYKTGLVRKLSTFGYGMTSVAYCHVDRGCKLVADKMHGNNGIARSHTNDTFYVLSSYGGTVSVMESQADDSLVLTDLIKLDRCVDNGIMAADGTLWIASFPHVLQTVGPHYDDPLHVTAPSSAHRLSMNTGPGSFYGDKFKIEKMFEDDGNIASGTTSAAYDSERNLLFLSGLISPQITVCEL